MHHAIPNIEGERQLSATGESWTQGMNTRQYL
jgi:hypothetical protein